MYTRCGRCVRGPTSYLKKGSGAKQLLEAIAKVTAGGKFITPVVAEQLAIAAGAAVLDLAPHARLSAREHEVFRLIASGLAVSEIAAKLALSVKTVSTYRARVLEKMNLRTNAQLTRYAFKNRVIE